MAGKFRTSEVYIGDEEFSIITNYREYSNGITEVSSVVKNNQSYSSSIWGLEVSIGRKEGDSLKEMGVAISLKIPPYDSDEQKQRGIKFISEKTNSHGIELLSEKYPEKMKDGFYEGRFDETDHRALFYGNPESDDSVQKKEYSDLKEKLLETDFLGPDKEKRASYVKALEYVIKEILNMKDIDMLQSGAGPERFINKGASRNIK